MFARTAQTTDYSAKAKSFQQSLKVKIDDSGRMLRCKTIIMLKENLME